jgi:hypothetical protein
MNDILKHPASA